MLCSPAYSDISFQYRADQGAVAKIDYEGYCLQHEYRTGIAGTDTGIEADVPSCIYRYEDAITSIAGTVASIISGISVKMPITFFGKMAKMTMMEVMMA